MTPSQVRREAAELVGVLLEHGFAIDTNAVVLRQAGATSLVTWGSDSETEPLVIPGEFGTLAEYRRMLRDRQYTCLLRDGSLIQISYEFIHDVISKHRICYYPCPVLIYPEDWELADDLESVVQFYLESEFGEPLGSTIQPAVPYELPEQFDEEVFTEVLPSEPRTRLRSPVRFDYDLYAQS